MSVSCLKCKGTGEISGFPCPFCTQLTPVACVHCYTITEPGQPPYKKCSGDCRTYTTNDTATLPVVQVRTWPIVFGVN